MVGKQGRFLGARGFDLGRSHLVWPVGGPWGLHSRDQALFHRSHGAKGCYGGREGGGPKLGLGKERGGPNIRGGPQQDHSGEGELYNNPPGGVRQLIRSTLVSEKTEEECRV